MTEQADRKIAALEKIPGDAGAKSQVGSVVDLFCGAGGLTHGFRLEGYDVVAGIDVDEDCRYAYEHNNDAPFLRKDITALTSEELSKLFHPNEPRILVGCAPCQPFSTYNQKNDDPKWKLVDKFGELIENLLPDVVSMENVPRLLEFRNGSVFAAFRERLESNGYWVHAEIAYAPDFGVPQRRSRLVLLASRRGPISLVKPRLDDQLSSTVENAIGALPALEAGESDSNDPMHRASRLSTRNLERIRASRPGGSWRDWSEELRADCHRVETGRGYASVYGRMSADEPSPTITTQFFGFGNGRFGHPTQDRGLSLREGAILQSFPPRYEFTEPGKPIEFKKLGRMIGNAVPVLLGKAIARSIRLHLADSVNQLQGARRDGPAR
ncbi:DNA cytosine methyltransferase [Mesorhizobium sp. M0006]|uniref:DNA cytosine methyltransferase n=1 Tax=Mesorhizobium sp. M0006 TaxID=2956838 RepID=UPI0033380C2F